MPEQKINEEELKKQFLLRDRLYNILTKDGLLRLSFIASTNTTKEAQKRHNLDYITATYMAQLLTGTSMIASFLKGEERISIEVTSNAYISKLYAEANQLGEIRGYGLQHPTKNESEIKSLQDILSDGYLSVTSILYNSNEPTKGIVNLLEGDVTKNLTHYLNQSDQIPSLMLVDVKTDNEGQIIASGGILIQAMPGADASGVLKLYEFLKAQENIADLILQEKNIKEIVDYYIPFEYDELKSRQVDYFCRCSKDKFIEHLHKLDLSEIKEMKELNQNELICHYCNNHYYLEVVDFDKIISDKMVKMN